MLSRSVVVCCMGRSYVSAHTATDTWRAACACEIKIALSRGDKSPRLFVVWSGSSKHCIGWNTAAVPTSMDRSRGPSRDVRGAIFGASERLLKWCKRSRVPAVLPRGGAFFPHAAGNDRTYICRRAVDVVFRLFLRGIGPCTKSRYSTCKCALMSCTRVNIKEVNAKPCVESKCSRLRNQSPVAAHSIQSNKMEILQVHSSRMFCGGYLQAPPLCSFTVESSSPTISKLNVASDGVMTARAVPACRSFSNPCQHVTSNGHYRCILGIERERRQKLLDFA
jgi:hypothetical protein